MIKSKEAFKIWAPNCAKWVEWVRPTPFVSVSENYAMYISKEISPTEIFYIENKDESTAIIVDLPNVESIKEGLALAKLGFRPIPLYNGTVEQQGSRSTVDNYVIKAGLIQCALYLKEIDINKNAPPAFLLDSNRLNRYRLDVSMFDNSWDVYPQDLPSAEYFLENKVNKIVVRCSSLQKDLRKILYTFQAKGVDIFLTNGYTLPRKYKIKKYLIKKEV